MKKAIVTEKAPKALGPYSAGIETELFVYTSGQLGIDAQSGKLVAGGIEAETKQALTNLKAVLEAGGSHLSAVVKTTVFLRDIQDFAAMNGVYAEFFDETPPARSAFQVGALPLGAAVEIEAVALRNQ